MKIMQISLENEQITFFLFPLFCYFLLELTISFKQKFNNEKFFAKKKWTSTEPFSFLFYAAISFHFLYYVFILYQTMGVANVEWKKFRGKVRQVSRIERFPRFDLISFRVCFPLNFIFKTKILQFVFLLNWTRIEIPYCIFIRISIFIVLSFCWKCVSQQRKSE